MENAIRLLSGELTKNQEKALELHYEIKKNGESRSFFAEKV